MLLLQFTLTLVALYVASGVSEMYREPPVYETNAGQIDLYFPPNEEHFLIIRDQQCDLEIDLRPWCPYADIVSVDVLVHDYQPYADVAILGYANSPNRSIVIKRNFREISNVSCLGHAHVYVKTHCLVFDGPEKRIPL